MNTAPLVSVVTPFYNTEAYLAECIESVLAQTYQNWEYILVNNCSTDRSSEIAQEYVEKDRRLRLIHNEKFLTQVQNYNHALRQISPESKYCKIVQADDWIFPECVARMVAVAEANLSVGIVSAYLLTERKVGGVGLPYTSQFIRGRDVCRMQLLDNYFFFGSPTSILLRAEIVRSREPFYSENRLHEDTEACYEILQTWDFGFVHQTLTFMRTENESIISRARAFDPWFLDKFIIVNEYGPIYLSPAEYQKTLKGMMDIYFGYLANNIFRRRDKEFWEYHAKGLATAGYTLNLSTLKRYIFWEVLDICIHPMTTASRILRLLGINISNLLKSNRPS